MQRIDPSPEVWAALCELRHGGTADAREAGFDDDPAWALYRPIAARGAMHIVAQVGQSLDGRVATPAGDARDVSGPDGIRHLHRLRALVDAVVVGIGTVEADNPRLTVRAVEGPSPRRVVIDAEARISPLCSLLSEGPAPILVHASDRQPPGGVESIALPRTPGGLAAADIGAALEAIGLRSVLVEGGARTIARFLEAGLVDRLHVAVSPVIIGSGPSGFNLAPIERLDAALRPQVRIFDLGSDTLFECRLRQGL